MATQMQVQGENLLIVDTDKQEGRVIPLEAIASWRALLKLESDEEAVQAILTAQDPGVIDETTGETAWASAYRQLAQDTAGVTSPGLDGSVQTRYQLGLIQPTRYAMRAATMLIALPTADTPADEPDMPDTDSITAALAGVAGRLKERRQQFLDSFKTLAQEGNNQ
ncbi:hypothetical protein [Bifidobacterium cuniculi]|uniref:Phage transcriptional regulator n=1 Tax=Bifidobacterium cuniculi TaxID=1688 RepID=A0A087B4D5_9BIFI|nr:hypothetical protein [Bifidobacterium cuniculi]KFI65885.1 phage transcriptional regulator [Bifidobacterium cuniculi]